MRGGKREGAGRRREASTVLFPLRVTVAERENLKRVAAARGLSVKEYLLRLAFDKEFPKDEAAPPN